MALGSIAIRLAKSLDVPLSKASKFVDDVGPAKARELADDVAENASRTVGNWWRPTALGGTIVGGGAYALREQDVRRMRQIAENSRSQEDAVKSIIDSDLSPEARKKLLDMYLSNSGSGGKGSGGSGAGALGGLMGNTTTMLILLIVLVVVLNEVLE